MSAPAPAPTAGPNDKVYVCKFVGTPGVNERLQTGQNPIEVSANSIKSNRLPVTIGMDFPDRHGFSIVVGIVGKTPAPTVDTCQALIVPPATPTTPVATPTTPAGTPAPSTPVTTVTAPAPTATPTRGVPAKTGVDDELPLAPLAALGVFAVAGGSLVALKRRH